MITFKDVYKVYENGAIAVSNVSFTLQDAGMVVIVGHSGSGKSTLLNLLSNNDIPSKGEIFLDNQNYNDMDKYMLNKNFAYVYQDFKLIENLSVYQNILLAYELANKDIDIDFVLQTAEHFGISELLDEKVYTLSGGQQQRVAIARAVASKAKIIVADEPTGNLDSTNSEIVFETLKQLSKDNLVVVVSHDKRITHFADRLIRLKNGSIIDDFMLDENKNEVEEILLDHQEEQIEQTSNEEKESLLNQHSESDYMAANSAVQPIKNKAESCDDSENVEFLKNKDKKVKKHSKIDTKSIFSYTKGVSKTRKKDGLSIKSISALTLSFGGKNVSKKVTLAVVSVVMIMLIFLSSAVLFSSTEFSFCKNMKINKAPFFAYTTGGNGYSLNEEEYGKLNGYIKDKYGKECYVYEQTYLNNYVDNIVPASDVVAPSYAKHMNLNHTDTLYIDDPSDLNLKFVVGVPPKANDKYPEIAISKTWYNYFCEVKRFDNSFGEIVDFEKTELIGQYIEPFNFAITGVFEDYNNDYNMNTDDKDWQLHLYNSLVFTIVRPQAALANNKAIFSNPLSNYRLVFEDMQRQTFSFAPNSKEFYDYYFKDHKFTPLVENEVLIDKSYAESYRYQSGNKIEVGSQVKLKFIKERPGISGGLYLGDYGTKTFVVKDIVDNLNAIVINEKVFNEWTDGILPLSENFAISSKKVTPQMLKDIRNFAYNGISAEISSLIKDDFYKENFYLDFYMFKCNRNDEYTNSVIMIVRMCIALPLFILSVMVFGIVASVLIADMIKSKSNEILILKTLGAKSLDIWKIFGCILLLLVVFQFVVGTLLGVGIVGALNAFWMIIGSYDFYATTFFITAPCVFIVLLAIAGISAFGLWFNVKKLNDENLRCAFQNQKK